MKDDSEQVLESIMEDGTFDELRKKIVDRVKQDVCLCDITRPSLSVLRLL